MSKQNIVRHVELAHAMISDCRTLTLCRELSLEALQRSGFRDPVLVAAGDTRAETLAVRIFGSAPAAERLASACPLCHLLPCEQGSCAEPG